MRLLRFGTTAALVFLAACVITETAYEKDGKHYGVIDGAFRGRWYNFYERGLSYADGGYCDEAIADFEAAIALRADDQRRARFVAAVADPLLQHASWDAPTSDGIEITFLPGVTDTPAEVERVGRFAAETGLDLIQLRNLNIDPDYYFQAVGPPPREEPLGLAAMMARLKDLAPDLRFGYFNPSLDPEA